MDALTQHRYLMTCLLRVTDALCKYCTGSIPPSDGVVQLAVELLGAYSGPACLVECCDILKNKIAAINCT